MDKILFLTTFPIKGGFHGGQIRSQNLIKAYKKAGLDAISVAYYNPLHYPVNEVGELDVRIPSAISAAKDYYFTDDYLAGYNAPNDIELVKKVKEIFKNNNIKYIHFEHPWMYKFAHKFVSEYKNVKLIFGSANIENKLKQSIYEQYGLSKESKYVEMIDNIKNVEIEAASNSDLLLCVTEEDLKWFKTNCKKLPNTILVPNAVEEFNTNPNLEAIKQLQEKFKSKDWCTFIASAHPPNVLGFENCVGDFISFLPLDSKLLIVGGVSDLIKEYFEKSKYKDLDKDRYVLAGKVSKEMLTDIINGSHTIILPITKGEGSNLKTAEALYSKKYVVGTSTSFRGYDDFKSFPTVIIADNKKAFRNAIRDTYVSKKVNLNKNDCDQLNKLTWSYVTLPLIKLIKSQL